VQASERDAQLARGDLMGPLHGFPYAVKDLALVKDIRTTFGSPILKDFVPTTDSIIVERLRKAGAIFIGKPTRRNSVWARTPTIRCTV
jgi:amidase